MLWKQEVLEYTDEKLSQTWSPEQIAKTPCGMKIPSFKTIYRWIDKKYLRSTLKNLLRKGKHVKEQGTAEDSRPSSEKVDLLLEQRENISQTKRNEPGAILNSLPNNLICFCPNFGVQFICRWIFNMFYGTIA